MNEIPPIPESENSNWNSSELEDPQLDELEAELKVKATSEPIDNLDDVWSSDNTEDRDLDIVEVIVEPSEEELTVNNTPDISADIPKDDKPNDMASLKVEEITTSEVVSEQETEVINGGTSEKPENEPQAKPAKESELFVDSWLDEPQVDSTPTILTEETSVAIADKTELDSLESKKITLQQEIADLQAQKETMLLEQSRAVQENMAQIIQEGTKELKERRTNLQIEIEKLERRKDRINKEMRANFAGSSQELAVKVQGFKEYLVGSLQDLARAADKLELVKTEAPPRRNREPQDRVRDDWETDRSRNRRERGERESRSRRERERAEARDPRNRRNRDRGERNSIPSPSVPQGQFSEPTFADQGRRIRQLIDKYRNNPDYYGAPWQLRRTFEPIHAKRVQDWFFVQGGRGTVDSMGSRLQNILVASATISILYSLHGDRCRFLVLTDTPENLGEWRKGLQDCLGISRSNFGSNRGVTLFDAPEIVVQRAERLLEEKLLPVIIIDETEELLNLSVLKFPLWLAFASSNKQASSNYLY